MSHRYAPLQVTSPTVNHVRRPSMSDLHGEESQAMFIRIPPTPDSVRAQTSFAFAPSITIGQSADRTWEEEDSENLMGNERELLVRSGISVPVPLSRASSGIIEILPLSRASSGAGFAIETPNAPRCSRCKSRAYWGIIGTFTFVLSVIVLAFVERDLSQMRLEGMLKMMEHAQYFPCSMNKLHPYCEASSNSFDTSESFTIVAPKHIQQFDIHPVEAVFLGTVFVRLARKDMAVMRDILCGAHVVIQYPSDSSVDGYYYQFFTSLKDSYTRTSSHSSSSAQYGVPEGLVLKTLLIGDTQNKNTWFQLEGAEWSPLHHPFFL